MTQPLTVTQFLHSAYREVYDALTACAEDESRSEDAPAFVMADEVDSESDTSSLGREAVLRTTVLVLASAGIRVRQHVGNLALTYTSTDPEQHYAGPPLGAYQRWPGGAVFTIARSILEGVATACRLVQDARDVDVVLRRTSLLDLWSSAHNDRAGVLPLLLEQSKTMVREAGFTVSHRPGVMPGLEVLGRGPEGFHHSAVIKAVFGDEGSALYSHWSGRSHHALWGECGRLTATIQERESGSGISFRSDMEEHTHVAVVANVAKMVAAYVDALATYYGRTQNSEKLNQFVTYLQKQAVAASEARARERMRNE